MICCPSTRTASWYAPVVLGAASVTAYVPWTAPGDTDAATALGEGGTNRAVMRALSLLSDGSSPAASLAMTVKVTDEPACTEAARVPALIVVVEAPMGPAATATVWGAPPTRLPARDTATLKLAASSASKLTTKVPLFESTMVRLV